MKKCFLFSLLLYVAVALNAQSQERLRFSDFAQHPELLTPEIGLTLSKHLPDPEELLPPTSLAPYNLRDSFYNYTWNLSQNAWEEKTKTYQTHDCATGKLLTELSKAKDSNTGQFVNKNLTDYGYYPNGKSQHYFRYTWDADAMNGWVQTTYDTSNQDGNSIESWFKSWNQADNEYTSGERYVSTYNAGGDLILSNEYELEPSTGMWLATFRSTSTYSNGNIALIIVEYYDPNTNSWGPARRKEYTYNGQGQLTSILNQNDYGAGWSNGTLVTMTYNAEGLLQEQLTQNYPSGNWENVERYTQSYYPSGVGKQRLHFDWANDQQIWVETTRDSLDESGNTIYFIGKYYDPQSGGFLFGFLYEYTYDNAGLNTQVTTSQLVAGTSDEWSNYEIRTNSYDSNDQLQETITKKWDESTGDYVNSLRTYYYNTGCLFNNASVREDEKAVCVHSNPIKLGQPIYCTSFDNNEELNLALYSMTGTLVSSSPFHAGDALAANAGIGPGMYVLSISNKKGVSYRSKLVVVE